MRNTLAFALMVVMLVAQPTTKVVSAGSANQATPWDTVSVYFGTGRDRVEAPVYYGSKRASRLELGIAEIGAPKTHQLLKLERPGGASPADPAWHFTVRNVTSTARELWAGSVVERTGGQALLLVHGYATSFVDAAFRAAQITYDRGPTHRPAFVYSWPSRDSVSSYLYDRESVLQPRRHFRNFHKLTFAHLDGKPPTSAAAVKAGRLFGGHRRLGLVRPRARRSPEGASGPANQDRLAT